MAYSRPPSDAITFSWQDTPNYSRPAADEIGFSWVGSDSVSGELSATLPALSLPPLTFSGTADSYERYTRPEANAIGFSWQGAPIYMRPAHNKIVFSWTDAGSVSGELSAELPVLVPPLSASLNAAPVHDADSSAILPPMLLPISLNASADQDIALPDIDGASSRNYHAEFAPSANAATLGEQMMQPTRHALTMLLTTADPIEAHLVTTATETLKTTRLGTFDHQHGLPVRVFAKTDWAEALPTRRPQVNPHQHGLPVRIGTKTPWADTIKRRTPNRIDAQTAIPTENALPVYEHEAHPTATPLHARWTHADYPLPGRWWPFYEPPGLHIGFPCVANYMPRPLSCTVLLSTIGAPQPYCPGLPDGGTIIIPTLEVYFVINSFDLKRTDDNFPIETLSFNASIDRDSWCWSFNASIPGGYLDAVRPESIGAPVQLTATINGTPIYLLVESIRRERTFGKSTLSISGRGRAAYLAAPYSPVINVLNSEQRTAQQLIADALTVNGVPMGWDLDWQITDWNVPAGAWSHTGSYIDAAIRIAEAGGAYVQAHDTDDELIIKPVYPLAPWDWDGEEADISIPEAVITVEGIEWTEKPNYNAVWIVGGVNGRRDKIKRTGTAADQHAPTIVDPLATDVQMTTQRGRAILSDTGRQALIRLSLPILPETGIIRPGALVDYTETGTTRRGLVRGVSITHEFPRARQTIQVETHELEPV